MPEVTYIQPNGEVVRIDVPTEQSVMEAAVRNDVRGIVADCGGACACATCQVFISDVWAAKLPPPGPLELSMIAGLESDSANEQLRLSCQLKMTEALDGLTVRVSGKQY